MKGECKMIPPDTNTCLTAQVHELRELKRMAEELSQQMELITSNIKNAMTNLNVDIINGPDFKVTWQPVTTHRLDTKALSAELQQSIEGQELLNRCMTVSTTRRFTVK